MTAAMIAATPATAAAAARNDGPPHPRGPIAVFIALDFAPDIMAVMAAKTLRAPLAFVLVAFAAAGPLVSADTPKIQRVKVGQNVFLEIEGKERRVIIDAYVV